MRYSAFGLTLELDRPIPTLAPCEPDAPPDVVCELQLVDQPSAFVEPAGQPWYESEWRDDATGAPGLVIYQCRGAFIVRYSDGTEFTVSDSGDRVVGRYSPTCDPADVVCYLMGPVIGFLLRLRGVVSLHASAIQVGGTAVALVGDACAGKSTTAAQFARMGYRVVTEDIAALSLDAGAIAVRSGCAEVALRPDAVALLFGSADALPRFSESWEKRRLDLAATGAFEPGSVPLGAIYLLTNRRTPSGPNIEDISSGQAIVELLANVYGNRLLHRELRLRELDTIHHVAGAVPVKVATTGGEGQLLERFCNVILEDVRPS